MTPRPYRTVLAGLLLFLSACVTTGPKATPAPDGARGAKDLLSAYQKHDVEALLAAVTDDVVISSANQPDRVGKEAVKASASAGMKALDGVTLTPLRWIVAGDRVLLEWIAARERTDANPTAYRVNGASLLVLGADGRVAKARHAIDALSIAQQSGVVDVGARTAPLQVEPGAITATASSAESANLDAVRAAYESGEGLAPLFSPDAVIEDLSAGQTAHGRAAVEAAMARMKASFPDATMTPELAFAAGPFVVVDRVVAGRNTGPLGPLAATGRPVRYHAIDVYELQNGLITRAWVYADRSEVAVQLGFGSAEPIPGLGFGAK
jgi:ketosteroid isomerase-like protein